jgi:T5orf172 domain
VAEMDDDALLDALGVEASPLKAGSRTPREERIVAGFEDILRFHATHGRVPGHGEGGDIFERLYAVRLDRLRQLPEAAALLTGLDQPGLLSASAAAPPALTELDEDTLLAELGMSEGEAGAADVNVLRHVRPHATRQALEDIAGRQPCADFERFRPGFAQVEQELKSGARQAMRFGRDGSIALGDYFVLDGQFVFVAEMGEAYRTPNGETNARLRVIFANGTESDLLIRSLQRALYKDETGRRIGPLGDGPLFADSADGEDLPTGTIYVLRSHSDHPFVAAHRELVHKIGVTGGEVQARIAGAAREPTYLLAEVEVVATYTLHNLNRMKLEGLFHQLFAGAQLDLSLEDRFGQTVKPREWFLVPLQAIDEAVKRIVDGSITAYRYDRAQARLVSAQAAAR